jgi:hypothetical protein
MSGPLTVLNANDIAYVNWASNYQYGTTTVTSTSTSVTNNTTPGYQPLTTPLSNFTVYNTGASTEYYATFIIQQQLSPNQNPSGSTNVQVATNVLSVPVYSLTCATDPSGNILYYSATADLILNSPTNPSSSVYNIFLNLNLFDSSSTTSISSSCCLPFFQNYSYGTSNNVCDVLLTLSSMGSTSVSSIFTLTSQDIAANSYQYACAIGGYSTSAISTGSQITTATNGDTLFTINLPISSIFPQISTPGILYRLTVELLSYYNS